MFTRNYYEEGSANGINDVGASYNLAADVEEIVNAVRSLNGEENSVVIISERVPGPLSEVPYAGKSLTVAGGENNQYICELTLTEATEQIMACDRSMPLSRELVEIRYVEPLTFYKHEIVGWSLAAR